MRTVMKSWDSKQIGNLAGKTALVTGANSGIGFHTALELGRAGARVVAACRDPKRGQEALAQLRAEAPAGRFELATLDLASLESVRALAAQFLADEPTLDILVNNAGVMAIPTRETTRDGFERQLGTNHLGHFALTALLLPALARSRAPRAVQVSSSMAFIGRMRFDDLQAERRYSPTAAYAQSKLANLLFALELGRREPWLTSTAAHPGATHTNLQQYAGMATRLTMKLIGQAADRGALPSLYAAVGEAASGEFYGPAHLMHMQGPPVEVRLPKRAHDVEAARRLWEKSEQLTGVRFVSPAATAARRSA